jgi:putative tryptophan/tyrosine transport system substrate-binding protein
MLRTAILGLICLLWFTIPGDSSAQSRPSANIAVLFPDIGDPYRSVFLKIIEGIEDKTKSRALSIPVSNTADSTEIATQLKRHEIKTVIALGRNGVKASANLERDIKIVAGGIINLPPGDAKNAIINSLAPDPAMLFARLKSLLPQIKRIHVVYETQQNAWLIRLAQNAAKTHGFEIVAYEASDIKAAMLHYQHILSKANAKTDALWLPQDSKTVQDTVVLPMVLRSAWDSNLAVFSSNVSHVSQGVLFALYPDNFEYGRKLGQTAIQPGNAPGIAPLKEAMVAINLSTANHLHINLNYGQLQEYQMTFPER